MHNTVYDIASLPLHGVQLHFDNSPTDFDPNQLFHLNVSIQNQKLLKHSSSAIWSMIDKGERYSSIIELYKNNHSYSLNVQCEGTGSFVFTDDNLTINWQTQGTSFEHYLQSLGLAFWLEQQGVPCIHANAIMLDNAASLIIAPSRTGKSTLTTHLNHHGFKLMTDDMAAIHSNNNGSFSIYPSWPKVRLWPDVIDSIIGTEPANPDLDIDNTNIEVDGLNIENTPTEKTQNSANNRNKNKLDDIAANLGTPKIKKVHQKFAKYEVEFGLHSEMWENKPKPLKAIYFLDRQQNNNNECAISPFKPSSGLMVLLQNSMLANAYQSMGIETNRLKLLAKLLESVPMFKISYSSGLDNLDNVGSTLKAQIKSI